MKQTRTYEWTRPQDIAAAIDGLSGAEVATAMAEGRVPAAPVADLIGVTAFEAARGRVVVGFDPQEYHYNALGTVHGGVIATLIDIATGAAVHSLLKAGQGFTTLTLEIKYHRAVTVNAGRLACTAEVIARGREIATAEARVVDRKDRLFATATSTLMTVRLPEARTNSAAPTADQA
ncbi:MAG: PaaI family thioesterase [Alphaproteobacteria bacterium]